ncbi:MAG: bifunctional (p)ppGpp synthetase/guanosine-3',5'-bis(diphosphate) 3'-pyrophosphohydrolase [Alphaproteobacteria bacterium]|nr:bifunctional (p)ppGpp synthetase/guanosine-3',5'-bis(diphosphate) 3'-pyrophosphohydrolase [Alphaproteobacteria bacterium]
MIRHYELIDKVKSYNPSCDVGLINKAYVFSMRAHGNQKRASGQPYLIHPLEVASILADLKLDDASICVGLLHDTVEDTLTTYDEIKDIFGREIADLVDGVTKLSQIKFNTKAVEQAENFRKMFLAMSKDIRVLLVKLADRLHNMRTMEHIASSDKRRRKAQETIDIYAPLADRIGLYAIKSELEDLSFKEINPDEYQRISRRLDEFIEKEELVDKVSHELKDELRNHGFEKAYIKGRAKTIYSIYRKMVKKNLTFDQLTDIVAYRVVMEDVKSCYEILGMIHSLYKAIPGRFKDYISNPKPNGYQSLHTSLIGPFGNRMEVQIRTTEMDEVSEIGVAAHWLYKQTEGGGSEGAQYAWLRKMLEMLNNTDDPEEFLENTKLDLFKEHVFVFTPKGDLVSLPVGATPLDFAYEVHSEVGHRCQAAKINGRVVPLRARLNNGDQIDIITNNGQEPSPAWREFVVTGKARAAINRYLRSKELVEHLRLGKDMLDKYLKKEGINLKDADLKPFFEKYNLKDLDAAYAGIAQGRLFPKQLISTVFPDYYKEALNEKAANERLVESTKSRPDKEIERDLSVGIQGLTPGISIHFGKCCNPLPGEPIVGIINTGRGVTVHTKMCKNLVTLSDQPDRWLSLNWDGEESEERVYVVRVKVQLAHEPGALSDFSTAVFNGAGNIVDLHIERRATDTYEIRTDIEVRDILHYEKIIAGLKALSCVRSVERAQ